MHIPHSEMLTERIGSTGAEIYMASATRSLTELKGIKYVNYDFEEGDHATPGVYNRNSIFKTFNKTRICPVCSFFMIQVGRFKI